MSPWDKSYDRRARRAVEMLGGGLWDEIPRSGCHARGCNRQARYEWASAFGTRWLCSRHREAYWVHDRILKRIRAL